MANAERHETNAWCGSGVKCTYTLCRTNGVRALSLSLRRNSVDCGMRCFSDKMCVFYRAHVFSVNGRV